MERGNKVRVLHYDCWSKLIGKEGIINHIIQDGTISVDLNIVDDCGRHYIIFKKDQLELID